MKLYTIEVCACGRITYHDVDCPTEWLGSGVYDVEYEVHREFTHKVSAMSLDRALKLVSIYWFKENTNWCDLDCVLYDPDTIKEEDDPEDGTYEEVYDTDYDDDEVEYDERFPIPDCYSEELPSLTLQEKLDIILSNWDREARSNVRFYKDKDDETSKRVLARSEYWLDFIDKLRRELKK